MKEAFRTTFVSSSCRYCDESYCITHSSMIRDRFFSVFFYVFDAFDFHLFSAHRRDKLTSLTFYTPPNLTPTLSPPNSKVASYHRIYFSISKKGMIVIIFSTFFCKQDEKLYENIGGRCRGKEIWKKNEEK